MSQKSNLVLRVKDLQTSVSFYQAALGWTIEWIDEEQRLAQMVCSDGGRALLVNDASRDVKPWMDVAFDAPRPGKRVYFRGSNLKDQRDRLLGNGYEVSELLIDPGFGQTLLVTDPDGYVMAFWEELFLADEGILEMYQSGPDMLDAALHGLLDAQLDLERAPGKWSIRQTVLHLIDSDVTTAYRLKFALAESGRTYAANPYSPDVWAANTYYTRRPIQTEVSLFRCTREHILNLVQAIPGALDHTLVGPQGETTVRGMLKMVAGHARGHIRQIYETREIHTISCSITTNASPPAGSNR